MKNIKQFSWIIISLVLFMFGAIFSSSIDTQFGTVSSERVYFNNQEGYTMSGFLYVPKNATPETPAPAIVTAHGNNGYTAAMAAFNIELSRRGYVVLSLEMEGHGMSDYVPDASGDGSYGGIAAAEYLMTLDFVDATQLGGTGHSKGSNAAIGMAKKYPNNVKGIILNGYMSPSITNGELDEILTNTNVGLNMSRYDEAGQDLLHHILGTEYNYDYMREPFASILFSDRWGGANILNYVNEGTGNWSDGTKRIFYTLEDSTHVTTVNSKVAVANALDFFNKSIPAPKWIDSYNQIFNLRFIGGSIEIIGFIAFLTSLASLLLKTNIFSMLSAEKSAPTIKMTGKRGLWYKLLFIITFTLVPAITFIPCFVYGENNVKQSLLFPFNPSSMGYLLWTLANTVIFLVIFIIWHFTYGKKHGGNLEVYGLTFGKNKVLAKEYILKSILYALTIIVITFTSLFIIEKITVSEASTWVFSLRTFNLERLLYFIQYFIPFFISFLVSGLAFSAILREDSEENLVTTKTMWKNQIIGLLQGIGGITIMYIIWNLVFFVSNAPLAFYRETPYMMGNSGFMCVCFSLIPMFGINSILSTHFSVKTRRVLVGALVCALFIVWITFAGQSLALPSTQSAVGALAK